jgi:hypothetical protein
MEKQLIGTQQKLSQGPRNMEHDGKTGNPVLQSFATKADLKMSPSAEAHNANIREGTRELTGTGVPLNTTAHRGWESHSTPMSDRTNVKK